MTEQYAGRALARSVLPAALILILVGVTGCATFSPVPIDDVPFRERAQTQQQGPVRVTVAVPSPQESRKLFGVDLAKKNIQPVWLEVCNEDTAPYWFFPSHLDPAYYSPNEAAFRCRFPLGGDANQKLPRHLQAMIFEDYLPAGSTTSGFVYATLDQGTKHVCVTLLSFRSYKTFTFIVPVPGMRIDYQEVDFEALYGADDFNTLDEKGLREALEAMPACTMNQRGTKEGDPLNLVFIGHGEDVLAALIQSGWDETEMIYARSALKTAHSFVLGKKYRYSPISSLYVYGRGQDAAFQKARESIHERNHLRLWLTPKTFEGKPVWIGQISRDIGVKFTLHEGFIVTHVIDPDVDNDRWYLVQNLLDVQRVSGLGLVKGVGAADASKPRFNLGGDPYFTDGLRAVIVVSGECVSYDEVDFLDWELPPRHEKYRAEWLNK
ncbi:MAG: LssY C-terminal domain-containing protein [Phycisphaerae bacterium]|nr:LssY C-terminal domain-containing protein [Phycisphaerae bacterium]